MSQQENSILKEIDRSHILVCRVLVSCWLDAVLCERETCDNTHKQSNLLFKRLVDYQRNEGVHLTPYMINYEVIRFADNRHVDISVVRNMAEPLRKEFCYLPYSNRIKECFQKAVYHFLVVLGEEGDRSLWDVEHYGRLSIDGNLEQDMSVLPISKSCFDSVISFAETYPELDFKPQLIIAYNTYISDIESNLCYGRRVAATTLRTMAYTLRKETVWGVWVLEIAKRMGISLKYDELAKPTNPDF